MNVAVECTAVHDGIKPEWCATCRDWANLMSEDDFDAYERAAEPLGESLVLSLLRAAYEADEMLIWWDLPGRAGPHLFMTATPAWLLDDDLTKGDDFWITRCPGDPGWSYRTPDELVPSIIGSLTTLKSVAWKDVK